MLRGGLGPAVPPPVERPRAQVRSEETRAILGAVPPWMVRSAQGALLALLLGGLLISWFIRYPDRIRAPISLTTREVPSAVVARASGMLALSARDGQTVRGGETLGYLESGASAADVLRLKEALGPFRGGLGGGRLPSFEGARFQRAALGEMGAAYLAFEQELRAYQLWMRQGGSQGREAALARRIAEHQRLLAQTASVGGLRAQELSIVRARYQADSALAARQLVSALEFQETKRAYLGLEREIQGAAAGLTELRIRLGELEDALVRERQEGERGEQDLARAVERSAAQLWKEIELWEQMYVLRAPRNGRVALNRYWANHQYIRANDEVLTVVPERGDTVFGFIRAPIAGSGKLSPGQRVRISLDDYPAAEYGELLASVTRISPVATDSTYRVTVALPRGLTTTAGRTLPARHEYSGSAVITTRDRRLLERFFLRPMTRGS
ncbi:MAG TPA: HlyD family efflux transporter periplasmic adaptor subunit [Longimicrobium sp.]|jgi:HlyD family secretion protein